MTCIRRPHTVWTTCPCPPCRLDAARMAKIARAGYYRRVPSDAAWAVVNKLRARGWSGQAIASAAGLPRFTIERAIADAERGEVRRFGPTTARALIGHGEPSAGTVGVHGARRRLQGLARQGYDLETLAELTGIGFSTLASIRNGGTTRRIKTQFHLTIRDTTARIGMKVGPSVAAPRHAARKGWVGLFAWEDIDDPAERPAKGSDHRTRDDIDEAVVLRVLAGERLRTTRAEKDEVVRRWKARGWPLAELERVTGWKAERYGQESAA